MPCVEEGGVWLRVSIYAMGNKERVFPGWVFGWGKLNAAKRAGLVGEDKLLTAHIANGRGRRKTLWEIVRSNKMRLYWEYTGKEWSGYILLVLEYDGFWGRFRGNTIIKRTGKRALFPVL